MVTRAEYLSQERYPVIFEIIDYQEVSGIVNCLKSVRTGTVYFNSEFQGFVDSVPDK